MLTEERGNLLDAPADALVNTVNTVGIMGKGLALQFKQAYPGNFRAYESACRHGEVHLGKMFTYETGQLDRPRFVINFPTIDSIAIPPLGCGNGGLDWRDVRPLILEAFADLPGVRVMVYPPQDTPSAESMPVRTRRGV